MILSIRCNKRTGNDRCNHKLIQKKVFSVVNKIKGFIFDFDGLILDTESAIFQSWQEVYQAYGGHLSLADWVKIIGTADLFFDPQKELEHQIGYKLDWKPIETQRRASELALIEKLSPLPGVSELLQEAKAHGFKIALASSSPCSWVTEHLTRLDLIRYFDCLIASDDVQRTKPDPELFLTALKRLGIDAEEAVVFEDSLNGVLAAKRAGIFVVAIPNPLTDRLPLEQADLRVQTLASLSLETLLKMIDQRR